MIDIRVYETLHPSAAASNLAIDYSEGFCMESRSQRRRRSSRRQLGSPGDSGESDRIGAHPRSPRMHQHCRMHQRPLPPVACRPALDPPTDARLQRPHGPLARRGCRPHLSLPSCTLSKFNFIIYPNN